MARSEPVRRGSWLTARVRPWLEKAEAKIAAEACGGDQRCPWCRQWMNQFLGTFNRPLPDGFMDEISCGNCGGTSAWKWEVGFIFVCSLRQPTGAQESSGFVETPFIRRQIAEARASTAWTRFRADDAYWPSEAEWPGDCADIDTLLVWNHCDGLHVWWRHGRQCPPGTHYARPPAGPDEIATRTTTAPTA